MVQGSICRFAAWLGRLVDVVQAKVATGVRNRFSVRCLRWLKLVMFVALCYWRDVGWHGLVGYGLRGHPA